MVAALRHAEAWPAKEAALRDIDVSSGIAPLQQIECLRDAEEIEPTSSVAE